MKNRIVCILMTVHLFATFVSPAAALEESLAWQVLAEINLARTEPLKFAEYLREFRRRFQGKFYRMPGTSTLIQTNEGVAAVDEAIRFLSRQKPLPPLIWSAGLAAAAAELAQKQGRSGATDHDGMSGSSLRKRIERHGIWPERIGESIAYGPDDPRTMVMLLLVDDGVSNRGHRKNHFDPTFGSAGVACGPHPRTEGMCVIDFADGIPE